MAKIDKLQDWSYSTITLFFDEDDSGSQAAISPKPILWLSWLFLIGAPLALIYLALRSKRRERVVTTD